MPLIQNVQFIVYLEEGCTARVTIHTMARVDDKLSFILDLDGTLIDSVYLHTLAWHEAMEAMGLEMASWRIHRRVGMSDDLIAHAVANEIGRHLTDDEVEQLRKLHSDAYLKRVGQARLLPGAREFVQALSNAGVPWTIATSSNRARAQHPLDLLGVQPTVPVVTRDLVSRGKPNPDLFLRAAEELNAPPERCVVVGDSLWDLLAARRARMLAVGLLSGGNPEEDLLRAGAYRVYADPAALLQHLDELGVDIPVDASTVKALK